MPPVLGTGAHMRLPAACTSPWTHSRLPVSLWDARSLPAANGLGLCCDVLSPYRRPTCAVYKAGLWFPHPSCPQTPLQLHTQAPASSPGAREVWKVASDTHFFGRDPNDKKCILCQDSANTHT